jgi:hypothetical protein
VSTARVEYLFALASTCHVPPAAVDELRLSDFGRLTMCIDELQSA